MDTERKNGERAASDIRYVLWDLDGTLTESGEGIVNSVLYALKKKGIEEKDREKLMTFVGPPLLDSFRKHYGMDLAEAQECMGYYREYFVEKGMFENKVYPGIPEVLGELGRRGYILAVATSKPEVFSKKILAHFGLAQYFRYIGGSGLTGERNKKEEVIRYVLDELGLDPSRGGIVMVGDRLHDVQGAAKNGIPCIGVLYGYGSRRELEEAGAASICAAVEELPECIGSLRCRSHFGSPAGYCLQGVNSKIGGL